THFRGAIVAAQRRLPTTGVGGTHVVLEIFLSLVAHSIQPGERSVRRINGRSWGGKEKHDGGVESRTKRGLWRRISSRGGICCGRGVRGWQYSQRLEASRRRIGTLLVGTVHRPAGIFSLQLAWQLCGCWKRVQPESRRMA